MKNSTKATSISENKKGEGSFAPFPAGGGATPVKPRVLSINAETLAWTDTSTKRWQSLIFCECSAKDFPEYEEGDDSESIRFLPPYRNDCQEPNLRAIRLLCGLARPNDSEKLFLTVSPQGEILVVEKVCELENGLAREREKLTGLIKAFSRKGVTP